MITLYTDGSCHHSDQLGAWGAVVSTLTVNKLLFGMAHPTTISRMELLPIIEGLRWIHKEICHGSRGNKVHLISDSEYTIKCIAGVNEPSKNPDLWAALDEVRQHFKLTAEWRGRNTARGMQICDNTANAIRTYIKDTLYKGLTEYPLHVSGES